MNVTSIKYDDNLVKVSLDDRDSLELTPQECCQLAQKLRMFLKDNFDEFDPNIIVVVHKNNRHFNISATHNISFWEELEANRWEPNTFIIFDDFISADTIFLDIGSWIGPTALYGAQLAKCTYAFEPDPIAYKELENNVKANKENSWASRLIIKNIAVAKNCGAMPLGNKGKGGDSMSSSLFSGEATSWEVSTTTLGQLIEDENLNDEKIFLKIDIEGGEYELMPALKHTLRKHQCALFLSIHPGFLMGSLFPEKGRGIPIRLLRRFLFIWHHYKLVQSLPFRFLYYGNGVRVNLFREFLNAAISGRFTNEIVGANQEWK